MMQILRTISTRNEPTQFRTRRQKGPTSGRPLLGGVDTILGTCLSGAGVPQIKALGIQPLLDDGRLVDLFPKLARRPLDALRAVSVAPPAGGQGTCLH